LETLEGVCAGKRNADQLKPYVVPNQHQQLNKQAPTDPVIVDDNLPVHPYNLRKT
jgi:hypothetical protein